MTTPTHSSPGPRPGPDPILVEPVLAETVSEAIVVAESVVAESVDAELIVAANTVDGGERQDRLIDNRWFLLGMLCLVTLFLGFPFLWKSRAFSKSSKVVITFLVSIETVLVFWAFIAIMKWCWQQINDSL